MKKYFLFILTSLVIVSACRKDDDNVLTGGVDLNSFPLTLALEGYVNPDITTYTSDGVLASSDIPFNIDPHFDDKSYFFDTITFYSEDVAGLSLSYLPESEGFNQTLSECEVTYLSDSIRFFVPSNNLDLIEDLDITMAGSDRSELKLTYYQTKLKQFVAGDTLNSTASFVNYSDVLPLIADLGMNDTLSVQNYQLVYRP